MGRSSRWRGVWFAPHALAASGPVGLLCLLLTAWSQGDAAPEVVLDAAVSSAALVAMTLGLAALWPPTYRNAASSSRPRWQRVAVALSLLVAACVASMAPAAVGHAVAPAFEEPRPEVQVVVVELDGPVGWLDEPRVLRALAALERGELPRAAVVGGPATLLLRTAATVAELPDGRMAPPPEDREVVRALWILVDAPPWRARVADPHRRRARLELHVPRAADPTVVERDLRQALLNASVWLGVTAPLEVGVDFVGDSTARHAAPESLMLGIFALSALILVWGSRSASGPLPLVMVALSSVVAWALACRLGGTSLSSP